MGNSQAAFFVQTVPCSKLFVDRSLALTVSLDVKNVF